MYYNVFVGLTYFNSYDLTVVDALSLDPKRLNVHKHVFQLF